MNVGTCTRTFLTLRLKYIAVWLCNGTKERKKNKGDQIKPHVHGLIALCLMIKLNGKKYFSLISVAPWGKYWVLDTDYDNYTLIYSCSEILGVTHYEFAWILSRQKTISDALKTKLFNELKGYGIDTSNFHVMDQTGCPDA